MKTIKKIISAGALLFASQVAMAATITFNPADYVAKSSNEFEINDGLIEKTINNSYLVYKFTAELTESIQAYASASTNNSNISMCVMIGNDLETLVETPVRDIYTHDVNKNGWANFENYLYGPFEVVEGNDYYYKITFIRPGGGSTAYACNVKDLGIETYNGENLWGEEAAATLQELLAPDYAFNIGKAYSSAGTVAIAEGCVDSTKNGAYVIYDFTVPSSGIYNAITMISTPKDGSSLNVNISDNADELASSEISESLTREVPNTGGWNDDSKIEFGAFDLVAGKTYYIKVTFLQSQNTWVGNLHELKLEYVEGSGVNLHEVSDSAVPVYYNINGLRMNGDSLPSGMYIKVFNGKVEKVMK